MSACTHEHDHFRPEDSEGNSLYSFIDTTKLTGLNLQDSAAIENPFKSYDQRLDKTSSVKSNEDDCEMILFVPFTESVTIKSICISGAPEGLHPRNVKLFVNRNDIDFTTCNDVCPAQTIELSQDYQAEIDYPLSQRKFQSIANITLYFPETYGEDQMEIYYIGFKGVNKKWKHGVVEAVYESRAMTSDHKVPDGAHGNLI